MYWHIMDPCRKKPRPVLKHRPRLYQSTQPKPCQSRKTIIGSSAVELKESFTVTCHNCRIECKRKGRDRKGTQRYQCRQCSKTFLEPQDDHLDGMYLPMEKAELVLQLLLEGNSVSTIERVTGVHHGTTLKLLVLAGEKCERIMAQRIRNVQVRDVECDELWAFIGKKQKRVRPDDDQNLGDAYTFVAIERHSKLVLNIAMGKRDQTTTDVFV